MDYSNLSNFKFYLNSKILLKNFLGKNFPHLAQKSYLILLKNFLGKNLPHPTQKSYLFLLKNFLGKKKKEN